MAPLIHGYPRLDGSAMAFTRMYIDASAQLMEARATMIARDGQVEASASDSAS